VRCVCSDLADMGCFHLNSFALVYFDCMSASSPEHDFDVTKLTFLGDVVLRLVDQCHVIFVI